jgi:hypothetical protein
MCRKMQKRKTPIPTTKLANIGMGMVLISLPLTVKAGDPPQEINMRSPSQQAERPPTWLTGGGSEGSATVHCGRQGALAGVSQYR